MILGPRNPVPGLGGGGGGGGGVVGSPEDLADYCGLRPCNMEFGGIRTYGLTRYLRKVFGLELAGNYFFS